MGWAFAKDIHDGAGASAMRIPWRCSGTGALRAPGLLMGGVVLGQVITLAATPLLARLYSPSDFGHLALVVSSSAVAASVAGLRLESALMLPRNQGDATALFVAAIVITFFFSGGTFIVLEAASSISIVARLEELPNFALWVAVLTFTTTVFNIASQFALRALDYGAVARRSVHSSIAMNIIQIVAWLIWPSSVGLLAGAVGGRLSATIPMVLTMRGAIHKFAPRRVLELMKTYWRFPVLFAPSTLLNSLGLVLPILFVGTWFGAAVAGEWSMAERIMAAPSLLVGAAAAQFVESESARRVRTGIGRLRSYYAKVSLVLAAVALAVAVVVLIFADLAVEILLGSEWEKVGPLVRAMVPMVALRIISVPMSKVLVVLQRASQHLLLDAARVAAVVCVILLWMHFEQDVFQLALLTSIAMSAVYLATWVYGWCVVVKHDRAISGDHDDVTDV